jgi:DNA anti-recombination protein RmuC
MKYKILFLLSTSFFFLPVSSRAVDIAPRISDREIIESLAELKAGQAGLDKRMDQLTKSINQRFENQWEKTDQRFEALNQKIEDQGKKTDQRFEDQWEKIDQRFEDQWEKINQRFEDQEKKTDQRFEALNQRIEDQGKNINQRIEDQGKNINQRIEDQGKKTDQRIDDLKNIMLTMFSAIVALIIALFGYIIWDRRTMLKPVSERLQRLEYEVLCDLDLRHEDGSLLTRRK